jgi:hypothetical protein
LIYVFAASHKDTSRERVFHVFFMSILLDGII